MKIHLLLSLAAVLAASLVRLSADEYDTLRARWTEVLNGGTSYNPADPDIAAKLTSIATAVASNGVSRDTVNGTGYWDRLNTASGRTYLWSDLTSTTETAHIVSAYQRLFAMALACTANGSTLQNNAVLRTDIINGLNWMYTHRYNTTTSDSGNWWDLKIGAPIRLIDTVVLLYGHLTATQRSNFMSTVNHWTPTAVTGDNMTGANRMWKARVVATRAIVVKSPTKLADALAGMNELLKYKGIPPGDGFYTDGSFIQHDKHPYNGGYGRSLIIDATDIIYLIDGSSWEVSAAKREFLYNWLYDSFRPWMHRGELMDAVRGRNISRHGAPPHPAGRSIAGAFIRAAQFAPAADATNFKRIAKHWLQTDSTFSSQAAGFSLYDTPLAKAILANSGIAPLSTADLHVTFSRMDRSVHHRSNYAAALSMHSSRIYNYESVNDENKRGWHTSDGMLYLYTSDLKQFSEAFWATINPRRLPGTTIESGLSPSERRLSSSSFVGGVESWSGKSGLAAMQAAPFGRSLRAKKAWFFYDDEIICLGADVTASGGKVVETIVENRKLKPAGNNAFSVNGASSLATLQTAAGTAAALTGVNYAHLAGNVSSGDGIGYYFPGGASLKGVRETRSGKWTDINENPNYPDIGTFSHPFLTLWFDHGVNPTASSYAYAVLPAATASATASYAAAPEFVVLENTSAAQAVKETTFNSVGAVFWQDATKTVGSGVDAITVNKKACVMTAGASSGVLQVTVSDPTQANTGMITVTLGRNATSLLDKDDTITVVSLSPIQFTVNVAGATGYTQRVRFDL